MVDTTEQLGLHPVGGKQIGYPNCRLRCAKQDCPGTGWARQLPNRSCRLACMAGSFALTGSLGPKSSTLEVGSTRPHFKGCCVGSFPMARGLTPNMLHNPVPGALQRARAHAVRSLYSLQPFAGCFMIQRLCQSQSAVCTRWGFPGTCRFSGAA